MFSKIISGIINGIEAYPVEVEVDVNAGIPSFEMSGYLSAEIKESRERIKIAIKNSGFELKPEKIMVNISPADIRKDGTGFDLPIAIGILASNKIVKTERLTEIFIIGELSLDGSINGVKGVLPRICMAKSMGLKTCIVPKANEYEGTVVEGIDVIGISDLKQAVDYINGSCNILPVIKEDYNKIIKDNQKLCTVDFSEIKGQYTAKRATLIATAGMHNIIYIGAPGSGKTLMAERIRTILPGLTFEESLEISKIYSIAGLLNTQGKLITQRPFRSPHHTVTSSALIGGGKIPKPGEVTLANKGVLFLDEMTEFYMPTLEALRQPLEDKNVTIARLNAVYTYPTNFMLVAAINPCKCGYYPDRNICCCSEYDINRYLGKISAPFWDRFDISVETKKIEFRDLAGIDNIKSNDTSSCITSEMMRIQVEKAMEIQKDRYKKEKISLNSELSAGQIKKYCELGKEEMAIMEKAYKKLNLTARGYHKILKTARTIADLEESDSINITHLSEAISYRSYDNTVRGGNSHSRIRK